MGRRRRPAPRPCPGFPRERERRWGVWWDALARGVRVRVGGPWPALAGGRFANRPYGGEFAESWVCAGAPFVCPQHRLRANEFGKRSCRGEWGMRWGTGVPCAAPLPWVPARAGTTMGGVVGCVGARGSGQGGGPLSRAGGSRTAPTTGVGRTRAGVMRGLLVVEGPLRVPSGQASTGSGRTGLGSARAVGSGGCDGGRGCLAPRPCPGFPRERERRWGVWWDALARGVRVRVGARSRGRAVREPPLRPGSLRSRGCARGPPSCALSTGSGRTDLGGAPTTGSGGGDGGRRRASPHPSGFLPSQE